MLLDEVHTYEGTTGAQAAFVIRRWRHQIGRPVQFVGLSATLREAQSFFGQLRRPPGTRCRRHHAHRQLTFSEGMEYLVALRGDPVSGASLLSTTIQTAMLLRRVSTVNRAAVYGSRLFVFTDDLDVTNRLYFDLLDAEGRDSWGRPNPSRERPARCAPKQHDARALPSGSHSGRHGTCARPSVITSTCQRPADRADELTGPRCSSRKRRHRRDCVSRRRLQRPYRRCSPSAQGTEGRSAVPSAEGPRVVAYEGCARGPWSSSPTTAGTASPTRATTCCSIRSSTRSRYRSETRTSCGSRPPSRSWTGWRRRSLPPFVARCGSTLPAPLRITNREANTPLHDSGPPSDWVDPAMTEEHAVRDGLLEHVQRPCT